MSKVHASIFGCLILATILGINGQGMAYFLNDHFITISPIFYLTILTIISIVLYLCTFVLIYVQYKRRKIGKDNISVYFSISVIIGSFTSCWSIFVLAMWWG